MHSQHLTHLTVHLIQLILCDVWGLESLGSFEQSATLTAGKFKAAELIAFLNQQAGTATTQGADDSQQSENSNSQQDKKQERQDPQIVRNLNMTQFEGLTDEEDAWLVAFYSGMARLLVYPTSSTLFQEQVCEVTVPSQHDVGL